MPNDPQFETEDPLVALRSNNVHERAAATRDLEKYGDIDTIPDLFQAAKNDSSPAVRHNAADAIADILSRSRLSDSVLTNARRHELFRDFLTISPATNNAVFMIFACLGVDDSLDQILAGFKDPRSEVRLGAYIGLLRYCQSAQVMNDSRVEKAVVTLLLNRSLSPDATVYLAQVCAAVGFQSALNPLENITLSGVHGENIDAAQKRLSLYDRGPQGVWVSDGADAGEFNLNPETPAAVCAITESGSVLWTADEDKWVYWEPEKLPWRHMWFRRPGEPTPGPALQVESRTFYMATQSTLLDILKSEAHLEDVSASPALMHLANGMAARFQEPSAKVIRDIGLIWMRAQRFDEAAKCFEQSISDKRTPNDSHYYLGECHAELGDLDAATEAWTACLNRCRSKTSALALLCLERLNATE